MKTLALSLFLLVSGCTILTTPTGRITIERQEFINTYAVVKVLYTRLRVQAQLACERGEVDCDELRRIDIEVRKLNTTIEAKIAVPESEINWAVVKELLGMIVGLIP